MGWGDNEDAYNQIQGSDDHHEGSFGHELLGGAAAFAAFRAYENHEATNGKPPSHALAKEILAGFAGAEVDKLAETKGLDWVDREKAKRQAAEQAQQQYDNQYNN